MDLLFWFSKSKTMGFGTVKLSITIDGLESQFSTSIKLHRDNWKGNAIRIVGDGIKLDQYRETIAQIESRALEVHRLFRLKQIMATSKGIRAVMEYLSTHDKLHEEVTIVDFESAISGLPETKQKSMTLVELLDWFRRENRVKEQTKTTYDMRKANIELYLTHVGIPKLPSSDFGLVHARNLMDYLINELELSKNYALRHSEHIKTAFDLAVEKGLINQNPLSSFRAKRQKKRDLRHLTAGELQRMRTLKIEHHNPKEKQELEKTRDIFLFLCFTGLHIGDYLELTKEDFKVIDGRVWLIKHRKKTFDEHLSMIEQKMHPIPLQIISKYGGHIESQFVGVRRNRKQVKGLPVMHDVTFNERLKVLEQIAGISIGLSSKIGRKTFAHLCLNVHKYDLETTARMMGCEVKNIRDYAKVERERVDAVVKW